VTTYQYSVDGGAQWHARQHGTTSRIITVSGLEQHHSYRLRVRAVNAVGPGRPSPTVRATTN
jgi:hypothetical protein